jgi:hypothetical protein
MSSSHFVVLQVAMAASAGMRVGPCSEHAQIAVCFVVVLQVFVAASMRVRLLPPATGYEVKHALSTLQLLCAALLWLQVFVAASASMRMGPLPPANCRACKYALNTLMNIFGNSALPAGLSQQTLSGLVRVLLMRLVDDHLGRQSEGEALLKVGLLLML